MNNSEYVTWHCTCACGDFLQNTFLRNTALATDEAADLRGNASCVASLPSQPLYLRLAHLWR